MCRKFLNILKQSSWFLQPKAFRKKSSIKNNSGPSFESFDQCDMFCESLSAYMHWSSCFLWVQNSICLDGFLTIAPFSPSLKVTRRYSLAFDKTYLLRGLDVVKLKHIGYVGPAMNAKWLSRAHGVGDALSADEQEAAWKSGETGFLPLGKTPQDAASQQNASEVDASQVVYAREMTEFLVWDSGSALRHTPRFSVACIPTTYQCSSTDMLIYVGVVLSQGGKLVKNVICDNAGNHRLVKAFLLGQAHGLDPDFVRKLPFWSEITWRSLPDSPLPRFPFRMAVVADEVVCPWTGTVHLQKNLVGNIRSPCRSICFGNLTVDPSGSLDLFLPPGSFIGYDPTSDKESASFLNPYHLIIDMVDSIEAVKIPWCLRGQLLLNLTGCLAVSSVLHRSLTTAQRLENSFTAFILLDLGNMLAGETAAEHNVSKAQCWLHPATHNHLQQLCGCTAIACYSYPDALPFKPWESTELKLEEYFGSLRCQYKSSQLTARDYALASCRQMRKHLQHCTELQEGKVPPTSSKRSLPVPDSPDYKAVNDEQYQKCALRALEGAFALMACCSKYCPEELSARYTLPTVPAASFRIWRSRTMRHMRPTMILRWTSLTSQKSHQPSESNLENLELALRKTIIRKICLKVTSIVCSCLSSWRPEKKPILLSGICLLILWASQRVSCNGWGVEAHCRLQRWMQRLGAKWRRLMLQNLQGRQVAMERMINQEWRRTTRRTHQWYHRGRSFWEAKLWQMFSMLWPLQTSWMTSSPSLARFGFYWQLCAVRLTTGSCQTPKAAESKRKSSTGNSCVNERRLLSDSRPELAERGVVLLLFDFLIFSRQTEQNDYMNHIDHYDYDYKYYNFHHCGHFGIADRSDHSD